MAQHLIVDGKFVEGKALQGIVYEGVLWYWGEGFLVLRGRSATGEAQGCPEQHRGKFEGSRTCLEGFCIAPAGWYKSHVAGENNR